MSLLDAAFSIKLLSISHLLLYRLHDWLDALWDNGVSHSLQPVHSVFDSGCDSWDVRLVQPAG